MNTQNHSLSVELIQGRFLLSPQKASTQQKFDVLEGATRHGGLTSDSRTSQRILRNKTKSNTTLECLLVQLVA